MHCQTIQRTYTVHEYLWAPIAVYMFFIGRMRAMTAYLWLLAVQIILNYLVATFKWHSYHIFSKGGEGVARLPPRYPAFIPYLGNALMFIWDNAGFFEKATCFGGRLTSSRVSFLGYDIYAFQDRQTIAKIWKQSTLSSPISIYIYVLRYFFGLPKDVLSVYRADDSGPLPKPYEGSKVPPEARVDHITHHGFLQALGGPGLLPSSQRYMRSLVTRLEEKRLTTEWTEITDLSQFFKDLVGSSLVDGVFGPHLLELDPSFTTNLWEYDATVPWLARGIPGWIMPSVQRPRERCVRQLKNWYLQARACSNSQTGANIDVDPVWGSWLMRYRQEKLLAMKSHNDDALARMDLGLAWGAVGNTIPCAMLAVFHTFRDPQLLDRVRSSLGLSFGSEPIEDVNPQKLIKDDLLSSIYAETLRLYVRTYFMVSSPHTDVRLGKWVLPQGRIGLMNAGISHQDETFWNSHGGDHPPSDFWADRFLIDPADPLSGPVAPHLKEFPASARERGRGPAEPSTVPYFSMEDTEGSWLPYGGGHSICPGRILAKTVILFACALLATNYDIEMLSEKVEMSNWRFGLGVGQLKHPLPFRIRARSNQAAKKQGQPVS